MKLNPLRKKGYDLDLLVDEFVEILNVVIKEASPVNPPASDNMKDVLREALHCLPEEKRDSHHLHDLLRYRDERSKYPKGDAKRYWQEFERPHKGGMNEEAQTAKKMAIRLNKFKRPESFKSLIEGINTYDLDDIVDNKKIILIDPTGWSDEKFYYIMALFTYGVKSYCRKRERDPENRPPLMVYYDECWMGINDSFKKMLPYVRDYNVGFTLAHQNTSQFSDQKLLFNLISECSTKIVFRPNDVLGAKMMSQIYDLPMSEFTNLENYRAWVKIFNKKSLIKTFRPLQPETDILPPSMSDQGKHVMVESDEKCDFLKECWFSR